MWAADMHCDTISEIYHRQNAGEEISLRKNRLHLDLDRMKKGGYLIQNFALFTPLGRPETGDPFTYGMKLLDAFFCEMEKNSDMISQVTSFDEIEKNRAEGKMSALLTLEEGGVCKGDLRLLRDFYRLGVRMMTLTWNFPNELGYPAKGTEGRWKGALFPGAEYGLTEKGIAFVREMERLGIIVDVSHLNDAGIRDVLAHTGRPVVASHSNARGVCAHPRNLPDDLILAIARRGGVIGINYCPYFLRDKEGGEEDTSRIADMVAQIRYIRDLAGMDCIGLGSDFDGIEGKLEIGGPEDLPLLERALAKAGFTEAEIEAVFYKNVLRLYSEILR